mmetsp:Transcript_36968/g.99613  ORF Transcript_36968/g.99613 Transcript_36968/m.99613 type:complete len:619 (+) Transcript_36968:181-2037(+)
MVRIMIKGGVWKNTEDEILKAAVMKYGKNQWSRVASLLNRKSAKQCKARWYEWLDPSIKKTEWTREEEEKLLHLAKLYPSQWRTIAPIVGRTAAQCMEHYEQLLDAAQTEAGEIDGTTDDPRRLRPGEIDPNPHTKPARPDPIDMDEDEKEMLAEARARLANTKGKKAKRKAREKQLEEAKRLAALQKRRELKAAGLTGGTKKRKRKLLDYRTEIPFQRQVPAGFYDVGEENVSSADMSKEAAGKDFEVVRLDAMEEKRRDAEEKEEMRRDRKKLRKMEKMNPGQVVQMVSEANDPTTQRRRTDLSLPAPQVSDAELEDVLKVGAASIPDMGGGGSSATTALMGDYQDRAAAAPTPMRTPRAAAGTDVVLQEARNLIALTAQQTPLLGGQNPELKEGTGFEGSAPKSQRMMTPSSLGTPGPGGATPGPGGTPMRGTPMGTPMGAPGGSTPMRDQLGVNDDEGGFVPGGEKARARQQKAQLAMGLSSLPEPQYAYEIEVPDVKPEDSTSGPMLEEDAADRDAREYAAKQAKREAELARRNAAVRRDLPRPSTVDASLGQARETDTAAGVADGLVRAEMVMLLNHDAAKYPVKKAGAKKDKKVRPGTSWGEAEGQGQGQG